MTHAQKFLHDLVTSRKLKNWCLDRDLPHITIYKIAAGTSVPTYAVICQLLPYIPCVDWFFFEDEEIPFPRKTLPEWQPDDVPSFVRRHKHDYLEVGEKYGTTEAFARNLFVNHRARPSINLIRACALDGINPVEFFTEGDTSDDGKFYPDRGDIVQLSGKTILVLTKEKHNRETHSLTGVTLVDGQPGILLCMIGYLCKSLRIIRLVWPTRFVVLAMGEVLSFGFDLAVSLPSDRRGSKTHIVSLPSRITRWGLFHIA